MNPSDDYEDCGNCGGFGFVYMCIDDGGCMDPEEGCDLCEQRCPICNPEKPATAPGAPQ